ncbi:hypothetical protein C0991_003188 [Blastosporella zonata]|nr:hypothetical protein C0991_003188 [Blastosporella zonata]
MGSRVEILNEGGFRSDGRRQYELRDMSIDLSQQGQADGSAVVTHGLTQVLVSVFGPREAKMRSQTIHDRANINVEIDVFVQVLQQDGALLQACINATTLALVNAGIPLLDFVCAVTGGVHSTSPLLDLTFLEENDLPNVTVAVMPKTGKVTLVTMETRLHVDRFEEIFRLAGDAGKVIHGEMKSAVRSRTSTLVTAMGSGSRVVGGEAAEKDGDDRMNEY